MRFGPGIHDIGRNYDLKDGQTVYIDGGAVVKGTFGASQAMRKNVTVRGRGIVYAGDYAWPGDGSDTYGHFGIFHQPVQDSRLEGFIALDSEYWTFGIANQNTTFQDLKIVGWEKNTDGIWFGPNSTVRDCFIMTDDDSVRPVSWPAFPDGSTTIVENLVIWHEGYGRPLYIPQYNKPAVQNITYRNITFIRSEHTYWAQSFVPIEGAGATAIRNILFDKITFEEIISAGGQANQGSFFTWDVAAGSSISGVTFRDFSTPLTNGALTGRSATEDIRDITFDNVTRAGVKMTSLAQMGITTNANVRNIGFR